MKFELGRRAAMKLSVAATAGLLTLSGTVTGANAETPLPAHRGDAQVQEVLCPYIWLVQQWWYIPASPVPYFWESQVGQPQGATNRVQNGKRYTYHQGVGFWADDSALLRVRGNCWS